MFENDNQQDSEENDSIDKKDTADWDVSAHRRDIIMIAGAAAIAEPGAAAAVGHSMGATVDEPTTAATQIQNSDKISYGVGGYGEGSYGGKSMDETIPTPVELSNTTLDDNTVENGGSDHTLNFDVANLSADGQSDNFTITLPDNINIDEVDSVTANKLDDPSHQINDNTIKFSVDPDNNKELGTVNFTVEMTLTPNND